MTHFYHFFRYHNLKQHIKLHSGVKPYECNICNKRFTRNYTLRLHKQKVKFLTKFSEKNHEIFDISKNRFLTRKSNRTKISRFYNFEITIFSGKKIYWVQIHYWCTALTWKIVKMPIADWLFYPPPLYINIGFRLSRREHFLNVFLVFV